MSRRQEMGEKMRCYLCGAESCLITGIGGGLLSDGRLEIGFCFKHKREGMKVVDALSKHLKKGLKR